MSISTALTGSYIVIKIIIIAGMSKMFALDSEMSFGRVIA